MCVFALTIFSSHASAQTKEIDRLGKDLAGACMHVRPEAKIIAVADLKDTSGTNNDQGHYFALVVTAAINIHLKNGFALADHNDFDAALEKSGIARQSLIAGNSVAAVAGKINVATIVIGDFRREQNSYILRISAVSVSNGAVLYSTEAEFRGDEFLDSLAKPFPPPGIDPPVKIKQGPEAGGIHAPVCEKCQVPTYTNAARSAKLQGTVLFETIISSDGDVQALRPRKVLGLGLDEAAYDLITKRWRMKPATDKAGNPISVVVPIEVTFRLY